MRQDSVRDHFDGVAGDYDYWKKKAHYYYRTLKMLVAEVVPSGSRVLEVGCGTGDVLAFLEPREGLGIDISSAMVALASRKHPSLRFVVHDLLGPPLEEKFDFVVATDVVEHTPDLERAFINMAGMLRARGQLLIITANPAWAPILDLAARLRLKMPEGEHKWRSRAELVAAAAASGLVERSFMRSFLIPKALPGLKGINSVRWAASLRHRYGLIQRGIFQRPRG